MSSVPNRYSVQKTRSLAESDEIFQKLRQVIAGIQIETSKINKNKWSVDFSTWNKEIVSRKCPLLYIKENSDDKEFDILKDRIQKINNLKNI